MRFILYWLGGYLRFILKGSGTERFLSLCLYHGIPLRNICFESYPVMEIPLRDFRRMRELAYKSGCIAVLQTKSGFPFFVRRHRRQAMFAVGMLAGFLLVQGMASHIWRITVLGNTAYSDDTLLHFLEESGYEAGMKIRDISCDDLEQLLRNRYERISWVSARLEGTMLVIELRETEPQKEEEVFSPGDLTADADGTIVEIVTRSGIAQVRAGDTVTAGQILISGQVPVYDDSDTVVEVHSVTADGDIRIQREIVYEDRFPAVYEQRTEVSSERRPWLMIGSWYVEIPFFSLPGQRNAEMKTDYMKTSYQVRLFDDFYLPVRCGFVTKRSYTSEEQAYTEEECRKIAENRVRKYIAENTREGELLRAECSTRIRNGICIVSGELTFTENAGVLMPIASE